ncbi:N-acetyltransferase family protein [Kineococcus sp. TBRC 1896]|uniref:N-acetyltransferase family protein n=1 Tax=Kineococcus mangrovi TaxID=1660183 RepID=A0ABV4I6T5_9ACTN
MPRIVPATPADAPAVADVFLAARATMRYLPHLHTDEETRAFVADVVLARQEVHLARDDDGAVLGFAAVEGAWLQHLYVAPRSWGRGTGTLLLEHVLARRDAVGGALLLHVFQRNVGARRLYERHGFHLVATGDGGGNEEREPDATYRRPPSPRSP